MQDYPATQIKIQDDFWTPRLTTNARVAIFHQWRQLEDSRCIDNFRIAAGLKEGFREGWFFADSDAYKWLEAAVRIQAGWPSPELQAHIDFLIDLLGRAQAPDGYLYTYNQIHFPGERWGNLMIEHELYCHGHLIEAAASHFQTTGELAALTIARKAADLLVHDFLTAGPERTSGHEEIEIALLRLYQVTGHAPYLDLATAFLERRGRVRPFAPLILKQSLQSGRRNRQVAEKRQEYLAAHPEEAKFQLPQDNYAKRPSNTRLRWLWSALTGNYFQMHAPIRSQTVPVGHAVRFGYLETAVAMLYRITCDPSLLTALEQAWERMVTRRMYATGGLGALPELEGFGRDDELDPEIAYAETCAALASLFWNWEMALIRPEAKYSDLFEWQLYNAALVGMGLGGNDYLYNNPLLCRGGIARRPWFLVPCCPSNLSRSLAWLGKYGYSYDQDHLWIHQYFGGELKAPGQPWELVNLESELPWDGQARIRLTPHAPVIFSLHLRIPSWTSSPSIRVNGEPMPIQQADQPSPTDWEPAGGYDPRKAGFVEVRRCWSAGDLVELDFPPSVLVRRAPRRLKDQRGKVVLSRGPMVYGLESVDNPDLDIFKAKIDLESIRVDDEPNQLGGIRVLRGRTLSGETFTAIPYHLWANRGESKMTVWLNT